MPAATAQSPDLAIIGGGVIGLAIAWRAAQRGLRPVVLDRGELAGGASHVAAGMLAPTSEATFGEEGLLALNAASAARYPEFVAELAEASGADLGYHRCGTLAVARDRDEAESLERELSFRAELGLPLTRLRPAQARRLEPALTPSVRLATHAPEDHAIDPRKLTAALAEAVRRAGAVLRPGAEVARVVVRGDAIQGVELAGGEQIACDRVLVAAGCWSAGLEGIPSSARVPVRPVKGQILRLSDPAGPGLLSHVVRMAQGYLVPRGDGRYVLGATVEDRGFETDRTAGGVFELLREAIELVPGVAELRLDEVSVGLRPGTPDNAPVLGTCEVEGLHWATGHYRHGILLTPITADVVAGGLAGDSLPEVARPFLAQRFAERRTLLDAEVATT